MLTAWLIRSNLNAFWGKLGKNLHVDRSRWLEIRNVYVYHWHFSENRYNRCANAATSRRQKISPIDKNRSHKGWAISHLPRVWLKMDANVVGEADGLPRKSARTIDKQNLATFYCIDREQNVTDQTIQPPLNHIAGLFLLLTQCGVRTGK